MARRDLEQYWMQMNADYLEMKEVLEELQEVAMQKPISPDKLDDVKENVERLKTNLDRINYIKYLLDKPTKKSKQPWYAKRNKRLIEEMEVNHSTLEDVHNENRGYIKNAKNV